MQLGPGSDNWLKELEAKVREGLGKWGTLATLLVSGEARMRRKHYSRLRIPIANRALRDGASTINLECAPRTDLMGFPEQTKVLLRSPQVLSSLLSICLSRNRLTPSLVAVQLCAHLTRAVQPYPKTIKESDKDYLKFSQLPGIALDEVEKFKDVHGFDGFVQSLENSNDSCAEDAKRTVQNGVMPRSSAARSGVSLPL